MTHGDETPGDAIDREELAQSGLLDGLAGLAGEARAERAEFVRWLLEHDFGPDQIRTELAPMLLPANRALGDDGSHASRRDVAEEHRIDMGLLHRLERALGLPDVDDPDAPVHLRVDIEAAAHQQALIDVGLDPDRVVLMVRRLADGLAQAVPAIRYAIMAAVLQPGFTELQAAKAYEAMVRQVAPLLTPLAGDILFVQLRRGLAGDQVSASERAAGLAHPGARQVNVAFADMVGFTRLGEAIPPEDLARLVEHLAELARDTVNPPVRLVKTIGDAVMLVCPDPIRLVDAMLRLSEIVGRDGTLPELRMGVASGWGVSRARDWFGSPVNVASRVTAIAEPGTLVAAESTRAAVGDAGGFDWTFVGERRLKGVPGETGLFRVSRNDCPPP